MIDEGALLMAAPARPDQLEEYSELVNEARGADTVYSADGTLTGPVTDSRAAEPPAAQAPAPAPPTQAQPASARPRRQQGQATSFSEEQARPQRLTQPAPARTAPKPLVMVPREVWPRFTCTENDGLGWTAEVAQRHKDRVQVRFTEARTDKGAAWGLEWLQPDLVVPLPNDDQPAIEPSATPRLSCSRTPLHSVTCHLRATC